MVLNWLIDYFIIPFIIIIGLILTIGDFRENKIKNKYIRLGIYIGLVYYIILFLITILNRFEIIAIDNYLTPEYYFKVLINTLIAFILVFVLWNFKLWAGGDAKLFTLYVFLIPLSFYQNSYLPVFPAFNLLINIIIPIFIYLLIKMLIYPVGLLINYLKNPQLFKEYFAKHKAKNKFSKAKLKEYLNTGLSFLLILIFFQLLRNKVNVFLDPYLGHLVYASYFFMGFVILKPLRAFLKEKVFIVLIAVSAYFIIGYIYFHEQVFAELHQVFALQIIFMMSYFYIFKYGRALGQFLYNSAEVCVIHINQLKAGMYIDKDYVYNILGNRVNLEEYKREIEPFLGDDEKSEVWRLLESKTDHSSRYYEIFRLLKKLRPDKIHYLLKSIWAYRINKNKEKMILESLNNKLNPKQKKYLEYIINGTDELMIFLKKIKGKLNEEQALKLKNMIKERNKEIEEKGFEPVKHIILHKTFSFAPFMLLGVVITLLTQSSIIHLIYEYVLHR